MQIRETIQEYKLGRKVAAKLGISYDTFRQRLRGTKYYQPIPDAELEQAVIEIFEAELKRLKSNTLIEVLKDHETKGKL